MSTDFILKESESISTTNKTLTDHLDGAYSRVHLNYMNYGLSAQTLGKLFYESSKLEDKTSIEDKLSAVKELIYENKLPFSINEFDKCCIKWQADGYPPIHHSNIFKKEYNPSYRVISNRYVPFLPVFAKIDEMLKNGPAVIAIEGGSASGKTSFGEILKAVYDCTVFHTDDFFLRPEMRTPQRYAEVGGNIDRERFLEEILIPLKENRPILYRKFDCATMTITPPTKVVTKKLVVIEGTYSMHPEFENYYDFSIFMDICPRLQKARIEKRNSPQVADMFYNKWIPLEKLYFSKMNTKNRCDMLIPISQ